MIRVLVATDFGLYREGLENALPSYGVIQVVGAAANSSDAILLLEQFKPDVILIDPTMPRSRLVARGAYRSPHAVKVIILGLAEVDAEVISWAMEGIDGFVTRRNSLDELVRTIKMVACGEWRCSPTVARALLRHLAKVGCAEAKGESTLQLTQREYQISHMVAHGLSNKEIARALKISVSTTKNHVHNILAKLGLRRRTQVAQWVQEHTLSSHAESLVTTNLPRSPSSEPLF